jgi:hypothetical protein
MGDPSQPKPSAATERDAEAADPGDPAELAERFLDLWQDQLGAIATDPDLAELVARLWSQWLVGPAAWRAPMTEASARPSAARNPRARAARGADDTRPDDAQPNGPRAEAPGAAPAAAPPRDHGPDVGDLLARLGALEKRLAALERPPRDSRGSAERRTRRR